MRIGYFTETYYPTPDGVSHYLRDVKMELESMGHEVFIFSLTGDRSEKNVFLPMTVPLVMYPQYRVPINFIPFRLFTRIKKLKLDIIHIQDSFFMGSIGYRASVNFKIPIVATFHTDFSRMKNTIRFPFSTMAFKLSWRYNIYLYRKCRMVLCPSRSAYTTLKNGGLNHVKELPLFVDTDRFVQTVCSKNHENFTITYIGRIAEDKGVRSIIKIADNLRDLDGIKFIIAGIGPDEKLIGDMVRERNLGNIVELKGYVDEEEKIKILGTSTLFIHPSKSDTFGISVLEALSSGLPAMVSKDFPLNNYSGNEANGILTTDFSNIGEACDEIRKLKQDIEYFNKLSEAARKFSVEKFSMKSHVQSLIDIYSSLIAK
ncbi:glycosyltransferase [Oxyplasma meridianum]|uniref:Glycosyltransferase n=1 Tax=Oxyplasma meridianum TaxID=3073602 RepID=A0AAX4NG97_9ARCH